MTNTDCIQRTTCRNLWFSGRNKAAVDFVFYASYSVSASVWHYTTKHLSVNLNITHHR